MEQRHNNKALLVTLLAVASVLVFLCSPDLLKAQSVLQVPVSAPPLEAQFVRQGDFAAALAYALGLTDGRDQGLAEERLASLGIAPGNGWISDEPVTPDIVGDLEAAIAHAADANLLPFSRDEALRRFIGVVEESGIAISPGAGAEAYASSGPGIYPDQPYMSGYYAAEGPPVITYYAPPPVYDYLYSWVPYPFWYGGAAFAGYYILRDHYGRGHYKGYGSNHGGSGFGRDRTRHDYRADRGYHLDRKTEGHDGRRLVGPGQQWRQEGPRNMTGPASIPRNRTPAARRPVVSAPPRLPPVSDPGVRATRHSPQATSPSTGRGARFSSVRTFHPSPPASGPAGIRQGSPPGEGFHPQATGGWSRGAHGGLGFGGRGPTGFRR